MPFPSPSTESVFYVAGGTLRRDAACYVIRQADDDLYDCLVHSQLCYVLTARQMGKSSLMIRTASRLIENGSGVVLLDLTAVGQHLSIEQWYAGLLAQMGSQLDIEDELLDFWESRKMIGPMQRWVSALEEIVLPRYPHRLTIFIDEIDVVRSLSFSTDEFFAGIRELYNRRAFARELRRLTFCLIGVATPADLIADPQATPFNIGRRIELNDFTAAEAAPLAQGLNRNAERNARLLKRILYWTNGHPYLTQRLCCAVAEDEGVTTERHVDRLCKEMFLSPRASELDDNLLFVRDRLLRNPVDTAALLELYGRVLAGAPVKQDETNPLFSILQLSGVARVERGRLIIRNRIYASVFDRTWVKENLPDAELRRQRAAFRRGVGRATAIILAFLLAISIPTAMIHWQRQKQEAVRRQLLYAAQMNLAAQDWEKANITRLRELLDTRIPSDGSEDLRGFEWYYFWRLLHQDRQTLPHPDRVLSAVLSPDNKIIASGGEGFLVRVWNVADGKLLFTLPGHQERIWKLAFSPDGKRLASASWDNTVKIWDLASRRELLSLRGHENRVCGLAFSPDGKLLATGSWDHRVRLWDAETGLPIKTLEGHKAWVWDVRFSPDGGQLASASEDHTIKLWDLKTGTLLADLAEHNASVYSVGFSPDGSRLASGSNNGQIKIWDSHSGRVLTTLTRHSFSVNSVGFSPDGQTLVSAGADRVIRLWRLAKDNSVEEYAQLKGHSDEIRSTSFSSDGRMLISSGDDSSVKLWDVPTVTNPDVLKQQDEQTQSASFSPDGKQFAVSSNRTINLYHAANNALLAGITTQAVITSIVFSPDGCLLAASHRDASITLWDAISGKFIAPLHGHQDVVTSIAFTPDGKFLVSGSRDHQVKLWDVTSRTEIPLPAAHSAGVKSVAISRDGQVLATGSDDQTTILWDLNARRPRTTLRGYSSEIWAVAFSPDGTLLATGSQGRTITIWDWRRSQVLHTLRGHAVGVRTLVFSPDGKRLASGDDSGTIKLWELTMGHELATLNGHTERVTALAFSPDGLTLISASRDGSARLWRAAGKDQVDRQTPRADP